MKENNRVVSLEITQFWDYEYYKQQHERAPTITVKIVELDIIFTGVLTKEQFDDYKNQAFQKQWEEKAIKIDNIESYIGASTDKTLEYFKAKGWHYEITEKDGVHYMITSDYRNDRIRLATNNNIITEIGIW